MGHELCLNFQRMRALLASQQQAFMNEVHQCTLDADDAVGAAVIDHALPGAISSLKQCHKVGQAVPVLNAWVKLRRLLEVPLAPPKDGVDELISQLNSGFDSRLASINAIIDDVKPDDKALLHEFRLTSINASLPLDSTGWKAGKVT